MHLRSIISRLASKGDVMLIGVERYVYRTEVLLWMDREGDDINSITKVRSNAKGPEGISLILQSAPAVIDLFEDS
jgi:hypothetical protein